MSIKTIKQRIALVAVSALTVGMITAVSAPVATANMGPATTTANSQNQADTLVLWTLADLDGTPDVTSSTIATVQTANFSTTSALAAGTSVGWVADNSVLSATEGTGVANARVMVRTVNGTAGVTVGTSVSSGTARTAVVLPGAKLSFQIHAGATSTGVTAVVTGGTLGSLQTTSGSVDLANTQQAASVYNTATGSSTSNPTLSGVFNVSGAAGTVATLAAYSGVGIVNGDTRTSGALIGIWTFTISASSNAGSVSLADSTVTQQPCIAKTAGSTATNTFDTTSRCANGTMGVIFVDLNDAFGVNVTGGTLTATATNGSLVNVVGAAAVVTGDNYSAAAAFDSQSSAPAVNYVVVTQPTSGVAGSTVVTITNSGTVVGTKTINWGGDVASIAIDPVNSSKTVVNGQTATSVGNGTVTSYLTGVVYVYKDAAGNVLSGLVPTMTGQTGSMLGASLATTTGNTADSVHYATYVTVAQSSSLGYGASTINHPGGTATANFGLGTYQIQVLNGSGTPVKSNVMSVNVSSATRNTFDASFDKASYSPGDIATLTITAKDSGGRAMGTGTLLTGLEIVVGSGLTVAGTACTAASTFTDGAKTCKFGVGNTGGAYAWSVALTTATQQAAVVGSVKVATSAVSNEEVLKSIVALIASINKQIAALQKLILQRR